MRAAEERQRAVESDFQALMESVQGLKGTQAVGVPELETRLEALERENASLRVNLAGTEEAAAGMSSELQRIQVEYNALASTLSGYAAAAAVS